MLVSFRNISNQITIHNVDPEDSFFSIIPKLLNDNLIDPTLYTLKFIFKGNVISNDQSFDSIGEENPDIIYMNSRIKTTIAQIPAHISLEEIDYELSPIDKLRASVVGVLVFIKSNTQLSDLFNNNFEKLVDIMISNEIDPLFEKMVNETCDGSSDYLDRLSKSLIDFNKN